MNVFKGIYTHIVDCFDADFLFADFTLVGSVYTEVQSTFRSSAVLLFHPVFKGCGHSFINLLLEAEDHNW